MKPLDKNSQVCALSAGFALLIVGVASSQQAAVRSAELDPFSSAETSTQERRTEPSEEDQDSLFEALDRHRYSVYATEAGFAAHNQGQSWSTLFDGVGFLTRPSAAQWSWGLELKSFGFEGDMVDPKGPVRTSAEGNTVHYDWSESVREWFINRSSGLEHGYTLQKRPQDSDGVQTDLVVRLMPRGPLRPALDEDGLGLSFLDGEGEIIVRYDGLKVFDAEGESLGASLSVCDGEIVISVDERDAVYPITIDPTAQQARLVPDHSLVDGRFGYAVDICGDTAIIGSPGESSNATGVNGNQGDTSMPGSGAAFVFVRSGSNWNLQAYLKSPNTASGENFGFAVAIHNDVVVVGAPGSYSFGMQTGAAYAYSRSGTTWVVRATFGAANGANFDGFGKQVDVYEGTIAIGAPRAVGNGVPSAGAVYVFEQVGTTWGPQAILASSHPDPVDEFAASLALGEDTLVVGASGDDSSNGDPSDNGLLDSGAAYVFDRVGTSWTQQSTLLKASNLDDEDLFGSDVAISGDLIVVASTWEATDGVGVDPVSNESLPQSGAAYVFARENGVWAQSAFLKASNAGLWDVFGSSVAVDGDNILVGAIGEDSRAFGVNWPQNNALLQAGAAYLFVKSGDSWIEQDFIKQSVTRRDGLFGDACAISEGYAVVAASREAVANHNNAGAAYMFALDVPVGVNYCGPAVLNSSGDSAIIDARGSRAASGNHLTLYASQLPRHQFGFFLNGTDPWFFLPSGSEGYLCVGGSIGRYNRPGEFQFSGGTGTFALSLDLTNTPSSTGSGAIVAGQTMYFQAWVRDLTPDPVTNFTDAVSVTFL